MDKSSGLSSQEAREKLKQHGYNVLPESAPTPDLEIFVRQLKSPLIYILVIAAGISFALKDVTDTIVIMMAVVVNTILGFYQERKAERGLVALKRILSPRAKVIRDGKQQEVEIKYLVPGDVVVLASGDRVPADGQILESAALVINEAILTGESVPVSKDARSVIPTEAEGRMEESNSTDSDIKRSLDGVYPDKIGTRDDKSAQVFMGTTVVGGLGKFIVTKTGMQTEIGAIAHTLSETNEEETPLQKRFAALARILTILVIIAAGLIFFIGLLRRESLVEIFATSVAVAVAAIPEGLVIALTTILALGMQRILKRKALVRKLVVAETLGTVTVIATDKTGTLTEGKLQVVKTDFVDKDEALRAATYANHLVDPLEFALWEWLTGQSKYDPESTLKEHPRTFVLPFDSKHKFSATGYDHAVYFIGAPEILLAKSALSKAQKDEWFGKIEAWAREGLRILALGVKRGATKPTIEKLQNDHDAHEITFLGCVGFSDPVRSSVKSALALCNDAGIAVKVVTGDYRWTAEAVMRKVGLKISHPETQILEGEEIAELSDEDLVKRVEKVMLFARMSPNQKLRIVEALKKKGEIVALLGDGVNDAPALKRADIGIVVGEATDVAKETADLVLLDSNFATIVAAVEEGRGIFANIQKVITYLLSDTFAEVTLIFLGLISGQPLPLTAAQILWINLVTDTFPTLALTMEPKEKNLLQRKPIAQNSAIISKSIAALMLIVSLSSGIVIFLLFLFVLNTTHDLVTARAVAFTAFGIKSLFVVFSLRDRATPIWKIPFFANPWLLGGVLVSFSVQIAGLSIGWFQELLGTHGLTATQWGWVILVSILILFLAELGKLVRNSFFRG